ncbi:MAG: transposase [Planctomycetota bacterium]|nr:transposase [Planctomycetota bacterium]
MKPDLGETIADTKSGWHFLVFLMVLVKAYAGGKVRLVCDKGRFHHTHAVRQWLEAHAGQLTIYWLPPYCPSPGAPGSSACGAI